MGLVGWVNGLTISMQARPDSTELGLIHYATQPINKSSGSVGLVHIINSLSVCQSKP
jgi:hypothetical protein